MESCNCLLGVQQYMSRPWIQRGGHSLVVLVSLACLVCHLCLRLCQDVPDVHACAESSFGPSSKWNSRIASLYANHQWFSCICLRQKSSCCWHLCQSRQTPRRCAKRPYLKTLPFHSFPSCRSLASTLSRRMKVHQHRRHLGDESPV